MGISDRKQEILDQHYRPVDDDPHFYQCLTCGKKVHAGERDATDLARHELECDRQ